MFRKQYARESHSLVALVQSRQKRATEINGTESSPAKPNHIYNQHTRVFSTLHSQSPITRKPATSARGFSCSCLAHPSSAIVSFVWLLNTNAAAVVFVSYSGKSCECVCVCVCFETDRTHAKRVCVCT